MIPCETNVQRVLGRQTFCSPGYLPAAEVFRLTMVGRNIYYLDGVHRANKVRKPSHQGYARNMPASHSRWSSLNLCHL